MNVKIKIIPHHKQRYPTIGDWFFKKNGDLVIHVSKIGDWRKEMLVAAHELVEVLMCKHKGISQKQVDEFDIAFEKRRVEGNVDEPGDDAGAPYRNEHCIATGIERILAAELGVIWKEYEDELNLMV